MQSYCCVFVLFFVATFWLPSDCNYLECTEFAFLWLICCTIPSRFVQMPNWLILEGNLRIIRLHLHENRVKREVNLPNFVVHFCTLWCFGSYADIKKYLFSDIIICCWYRFLSYIQVLFWLSNANFKFPMFSFSWLHRPIKDCLILYR